MYLEIKGRRQEIPVGSCKSIYEKFASICLRKKN